MTEKDYTKYSATELAQEASFIRWVRGVSPSDTSFWEQWLHQNPGRGEVVAEARRLVQAMDFAPDPPSKERVDALWERIDRAAGEPDMKQPRPARRRRLRWLGYVAAACALLLLVLQWWNNDRSWEVIRTEAGQRMVYLMPDSTVVELNAATTLRYQPGTYNAERLVRLEGEAFFDVRPGRPFVVGTGQGEITVLGTSFNVLARPGDFSVACFTGKVGVRLLEAENSAVLTSGEAVRWEEGSSGLSGYSFDKDREAAWRQGRVYYEDEPLSKVADRLEQQFDIDITGDSALLQRRATGFFRLNHPDSALYDVTWTLNLQFRRQGREVRIFEN